MIEDGAEEMGVERNVAVRTSVLTSVTGSKFRLEWVRLNNYVNTGCITLKEKQVMISGSRYV
jgi:hypothetical protein